MIKPRKRILRKVEIIETPPSDKEGTLEMQPSGRWAVCRPGRAPVEITSGEVFRVEVHGELRVTLHQIIGEASTLLAALFVPPFTVCDDGLREPGRCRLRQP